ncbi:MAG: hypothetical protein LBJ95_02635 [Oscillospiraceae bacterium]|jgi:hypothetical protein|nr:hypothetical protein [Oscillospiraceae bacterium]
MNINFRKLKNSLLSLGLSATLFSASGLKTLAEPLSLSFVKQQLKDLLPAPTAPPDEMARGVRLLLTRASLFTHEGAQRQVKDADGRISKTEEWASVVRLNADTFYVNTHNLANVAGVAKSTVNARLKAAKVIRVFLTESDIRYVEGIVPTRIRSNYWRKSTLTAAPPIAAHALFPDKDSSDGTTWEEQFDLADE